jgi:hypothetical protein
VVSKTQAMPYCGIYVSAKKLTSAVKRHGQRSEQKNFLQASILRSCDGSASR